MIGFFQTEKYDEDRWVDSFYIKCDDDSWEQAPPEERFMHKDEQYRRVNVKVYPIEWSPTYRNAVEIHL